MLIVLNMVPQIKVKTTTGMLPIKATSGSAGYDIASAEDAVIQPGHRSLISTGLYLSMPIDFEAQIRSRSGLAAKHGIIVLNAPGTIDSDYRDEVKVILYNTSHNDFRVEKGMRIAQMVFAKLEQCELHETKENLTDTDRKGGFGSTGL
jgi:dUTP pyrophosphatase